MDFTTSEQTNLSRRSVMRGAGVAGAGVMATVMMGRRFAAAQDGTPVAETRMEPTAPLDPIIGDTVVLIGTDGQPLVEFTTNDYEDGWTEYAPSEAPDRGTRYIAVTITADVVARAAFNLRLRDLVLQDADGFLSQPLNIRNEDRSYDGFFPR